MLKIISLLVLRSELSFAVLENPLLWFNENIHIAMYYIAELTLVNDSVNNEHFI